MRVSGAITLPVLGVLDAARAMRLVAHQAAWWRRVQAALAMAMAMPMPKPSLSRDAAENTAAVRVALELDGGAEQCCCERWVRV